MERKTKLLSFCLIFLLFSIGCYNFKQPRNRVEHYTLEYASPVIPNLKPLPASLKVERFTVAPDYNTRRIIYRDGSFKRNEYFYHKWRANPGDMVASYLTRDIKNSGLFKAVLPHGTDFPFSYVLEGSVDEFVEWDEAQKWNAVLAVTITLMAAHEPDVAKRVLFQRTYHSVKPFKEKNPQGLTEAMSQAMADISAEIIQDVYAALKDRS